MHFKIVYKKVSCKTNIYSVALCLFILRAWIFQYVILTFCFFVNIASSLLYSGVFLPPTCTFNIPLNQGLLSTLDQFQLTHALFCFVSCFNAEPERLHVCLSLRQVMSWSVMPCHFNSVIGSCCLRLYCL